MLPDHRSQLVQFDAARNVTDKALFFQTDVQSPASLQNDRRDKVKSKWHFNLQLCVTKHRQYCSNLADSVTVWKQVLNALLYAFKRYIDVLQSTLTIHSVYVSLFISVTVTPRAVSSEAGTRHSALVYTHVY